MGDIVNYEDEPKEEVLPQNFDYAGAMAYINQMQSQNQWHRGSQDEYMPPKCGTPDIETGYAKVPIVTKTPQIEQTNNNVFSMQADVISVLSGHSHSRSAMKQLREKKNLSIGKSHLSQSNYGGNGYSRVQNILLENNRRTGGQDMVDFQMIPSPKSFNETYPDVVQDLNLESLSNGDLSRHDGQSIQRSFTLL